jgi:hypothetical protein
LDSGETISKNASEKFSNSRLVVAHFENAQILLTSLLNKWTTRKLFFQRGFYSVIQQMEKLEGGLSQVERQTLIELAEFSGAKKVKVIDHTKKLSHNKARLQINKNT